MLPATLPQQYAKWMGVDWATQVERNPDGSAKYVPNGLRVVEALLSRHFSPDDIAVCYPDELEQFVGRKRAWSASTRTTPWESPSPPTCTPAFTGGRASQSTPMSSGV